MSPLQEAGGRACATGKYARGENVRFLISTFVRLLIAKGAVLPKLVFRLVARSDVKFAMIVTQHILSNKALHKKGKCDKVHIKVVLALRESVSA